MLRIDVPTRGALTLEHLVCDLNGTLAEDGLLLAGIADRLAQLNQTLHIHVLTADTYRTLETAQREALMTMVGSEQPRWERISDGADKAAYVRTLGVEHVVAIGNGVNDVEMFEAVALSILVMGSEGAAVRALLAAEVVAPSPLVALDLLLHPKRLAATLRP